MNCTQCINALYDKIWGVYRCATYKRIVHDQERVNTCKSYKKKKLKDK